MPAASVVQGMELSSLQWEVFAQTQIARYLQLTYTILATNCFFFSP